MGLWQRWMVSYAVAYRDGLPNKIVFAGFSGDQLDHHLPQPWCASR
jgi:hypothetical protein